MGSYLENQDVLVTSNPPSKAQVNGFGELMIPQWMMLSLVVLLPCLKVLLSV